MHTSTTSSSIGSHHDVANVYKDVATAILKRFYVRRLPFILGHQFLDYVFDAMPFLDLMLADLGLNPPDEGGDWRRELFRTACHGRLSRDYRGVAENEEEQWRQYKGYLDAQPV